MQYDLEKINARRAERNLPPLSDYEAGTALMQIPKPFGEPRDNDEFLSRLVIPPKA